MGGSASGWTPEAIYWFLGETLSRLGEKWLGNPLTALVNLILAPTMAEIRALTAPEATDHMMFHMADVSALCFEHMACLYFEGILKAYSLFRFCKALCIAWIGSSNSEESKKPMLQIVILWKRKQMNWKLHSLQSKLRKKMSFLCWEKVLLCWKIGFTKMPWLPKLKLLICRPHSLQLMRNLRMRSRIIQISRKSFL